MNKSKLKKKIESNNLKSLSKKCCFIGFLCIQNVFVNDNIQLKKNLNKQGFKYILIKNTVIFKNFFKYIPKSRGIIFGSIAIYYSTTIKYNITNDTNFISLSEVFSITKKEKNIFFLGGFFKGSLVNRLFENQVVGLKNLESLHLEYIFLIQRVLNKVSIIISKPKNQLFSLLSIRTKSTFFNHKKLI
jgi:ribosomal protein L10